MRTTVKIDDQLLKEAKKVALESARSLAEVIDDALRESFARRHRSADRQRVILPSFKGTGVLPGVNMEDWASVMDLMDEDRERR